MSDIELIESPSSLLPIEEGLGKLKQLIELQARISPKVLHYERSWKALTIVCNRLLKSAELLNSDVLSLTPSGESAKTPEERVNSLDYWRDMAVRRGEMITTLVGQSQELEKENAELKRRLEGLEK